MEARAPARAPGVPGRGAPSSPRAQRPWPAWAALYLVAGAVVLALEHVWRGSSYWLFSEGVYLATAREVLDGESLYTDVAAAQPPPIFLLGAALLAISESLLFVRGALALATLATGALVAVIVARLTGRRGLGVVAGLATLLAPWTLREHATLTPDPLAAAPLLGAALLAARPRSRASAAAGALAALGASLKLAFVLPAAALLPAARGRLPYAAGAVAMAAVLAIPSFAVWDGALWESVVGAQGDTGFQAEVLPGLVAQSIWNLGPLLALAALAHPARARARDPALYRSTLALLLGSLALVLTFVKDGTYLNQLAVVEPVAVALAACGVAWFLEDRGMLARRRRLATAGVAAAVAFVALQTASLLALPDSPLPFGNPFLSRAPGYELSEAEVRRAAEVARACPPGAPYSGSPFVAFAADRPLPGGQADRFIVGKSPVHSELRERVRSAGPLCPYAGLGGLPSGGGVDGPFK